MNSVDDVVGWLDRTTLKPPHARYDHAMQITRRQAIYLIVVVILALGALVALDRVIEEFSPWDYDDFERWINDLGAWGPIIYILFFAASMVVAPIPTGPAPVAAAAAFGGVLGFAYTLIAGFIGATLCFWRSTA